MTYSIAQFFLLGALTMIFVGLITAPIRKLALRVGAVDAPTLARKTQKEPIPYLGGVAIALGISIITLGAVFIGAESFAGERAFQYVQSDDESTVVLFEKIPYFCNLNLKLKRCLRPKQIHPSLHVM